MMSRWERRTDTTRGRILRGVEWAVLLFLLATSGYSTVRGFIFDYYDSGDGRLSEMRRDPSPGGSTTTMQAYYPRRMRVNDEAYLIVIVDRTEASPYSDCETTVTSAGLAVKNVGHPERYLISSATAGHKLFQVSLDCDGKRVLYSTGGGVTIYEDEPDWLSRAGSIAQILGIPTLIAILVTEMIRRRTKEKTQNDA